MEKISEYREIARMLKDGKTVVKKTRITKERCLEESLSGGFTLVICGGGHISYSLCNLAKMLGYQVWIIDDREEFANEERFPQADHVYCMGFEEAFDKVIFPESAWYVIVTRGHQNDYECLKKVMERKSSYVGMIGSKGKVRTTLERLKKDGVTKEQQEQIHAPIGLPIGANTPEEITVSIMAEMIQEKSKIGYTDLPKEMIEWLLNKKQPMVMTTIVGKKGSVEEQEDAFSIGCMCTLRQLEIHEALNRYFGGAMKACTRHIVGTQFRNGATVGGSIFGRFGFSDILTCLLALDTYVELYHAGVIALSEFVEMPRDNDILVRIIIKKDGRKIAYRSHREAATDFPVIACAVANKDDQWYVSVGARSGKAKLQVRQAQIENAETFTKKVIAGYTFSSNMRGSEVYRRHLAEVYTKRAVEEILAKNSEKGA